MDRKAELAALIQDQAHDDTLEQRPEWDGDWLDALSLDTLPENVAANRLWEDVIGSADSQKVEYLISRLSPDLQELFYCLYGDGYSYRETAQAMGISRDKVQRLHAELKAAVLYVMEPSA